jgi:hypothetical protein
MVGTLISLLYPGFVDGAIHPARKSRKLAKAELPRISESHESAPDQLMEEKKNRLEEKNHE